uniref:Uncharacterized protein n=1 Tax=Globisporangium ultimum (strain ATCC 200006 / CBS 805.95 / DAOM BR144) TaxID=431595 RepID=K3XAE6_GLOUD
METLVVPFRPPLDDWSPESIQRCQDEIRINLFDQVIVPGEDNEARVDAAGGLNGTGAQLRSFHQENYYLGGVSIPFTTLYFNSGSLEATLRCNMPIEHVGYANLKSADSDDDGSIGIGTPRISVDDETPRLKQKSPTRSKAMGEIDQDGVKKNSQEATFIDLMMTLDPLLPQPVKPFGDTVVTIGSSTDVNDANKRLAQYVMEWSTKAQNTNAATKQRNFHVFVRNLNSGNTFLSQYLRAQQPPRSGIFSKPPLTVQKLVRFVSLIPFLNDWHLFDGDKDIWSTSQEFLGINAGDYEEHAVLLCNYFHWLDRDEPNFHNYLVIGHAVPEGEGVYVLRQDAYKIPQRSVLWNASTGIGYHVWDEKCPMRDVSLVVSSENIYANMQHTSRFRDLSWDIETNLKAWKPFFHVGAIQKSNFALPCVQSRDLAYEETPTKYIHSVETEIRETLKLEIRRWRSSRFTTTFNIDAGMKLGRHLEELEAHMQGQSTEPTNQPNATPAGTTNVLQELQRTKEISGMPLNVTFTDVDKVVDMNIHWNERANVEFALAVHVCGYPNCVLSVWVYFASLVTK